MAMSPKNSWKKFVSQKINDKNRFSLHELAKGLKKVDFLTASSEEFRIKEYFSTLPLDLARIKYREVAKCMKTCRTHFTSDLTNMRELFLCHCKSHQDSLDMWWDCPLYRNLRINKRFV